MARGGVSNFPRQVISEVLAFLPISKLHITLSLVFAIVVFVSCENYLIESSLREAQLPSLLQLEGKFSQEGLSPHPLYHPCTTAMYAHGKAHNEYRHYVQMLSKPGYEIVT